MATKTSFTQEQIENISWVAQKFGGIENQNLQNAVNSKYGAWAFNAFIDKAKNVVAPVANAVGNVADTATGFFNPQAVTPTQSQGLTGINSPNRNQPSSNTSLLPGTPNVARPKPVQPADTDVPVIPTDPADIAWNAKQAQFDQANPVGTEMANVNYNPQPVTATAPTTTTATAKPATQAKTEAVSPDARSAEINANLAEGLKNDAGIQKAVQSGDLATFRARYGYDTADQNKKQLLDSFFQSYQPTGNEDYYTMMRSGQRIANPASLRSPEYKQAVSRFNQFKKFANYDVNALASALNGGMLIEGTKAYEDLSNDPNAKMKLDQAKVFNNASGKTTDYNAVGTNATSEIMKENVNTAKMFDDGVISAEEYKAALETPEITAQRKDIQADKIKYDTLKAQYDNIETDVETELKGKDVTSSFKNALIADRRKGMYKDLQIATDTYNTKLGTLTDMTKQQAGLFETNLGLYKERKQQENARAMIDYQMAYQNPDIDSENPQIAQIAANKIVNSALEFAQANGVPVQRNSAQIISEAQAYARENGVTFAQALQTTFTDPLHAKPEFVNAMQNIQSGKEPVGKLQVVGQRVDPNTGAVVNVYGTVDKSGNVIPAGGTQFSGTPATWVPVGWTDLVKALASWKVNGQKFFGVYATADTEGNTRASIYEKIKNVGLESYMAKNAKGSPVTAEMINASAEAYGIEPEIIATFLQADSNFGLKGLARGNMNPGNVGQFDRFGTNAVKGYASWQEGVDAAADNLSKRQTAMAGIVWTSESKSEWADMTELYKGYLNWKLPTGMKVGTGNFNSFVEGYQKWKQETRPLSESTQKRVDSYADDYSQQPAVKSYARFSSLLPQYENVDVKQLSSSQQQSIISDFAKALDPDSVVREGEYATVQKYAGQSLGQRTMNDINLALTGQWLLSEDAMKQVIKAIQTRAKSYADAEKTIRKQSISKINRATGNQDAESYLLIPGGTIPQQDTPWVALKVPGFWTFSSQKAVTNTDWMTDLQKRIAALRNK